MGIDPLQNLSAPVILFTVAESGQCVTKGEAFPYSV